MTSRDVFLISAARTPVGAFQGGLSSVSAVELGRRAIEGALARAGLSGDDVDETFMGNVLSAGLGQAPARQAAIYAGIAHKTPATTVSKVCGSGMQAAVLGAKSILLGDADVVVVGGMESMSGAPYLLPGGRAGLRMGDGQVVDAMIRDGLWDPYGDFHMGVAGELCASTYKIARASQDAFARESYRRALEAQQCGALAQEIVAVPVIQRGQEVSVDTDEEPGRVDLRRMDSLRPVFREDGTITAANASKISDGAAALVLASGEGMARYGLKPLARLRSYGGFAQQPEWYSTAPVGATRQALRRAGLTVDDVDLYEINEAFAVVTVVCAQQLGVSLDRVNVRGGAVALGHPIGATGARLLVTLLHSMVERSAARGLATLCIGGGEALAVLLEAV